MTTTINKLVLDFLTRANRPYAFGELAEKCGTGTNKASVQKALDKLEAQQLVGVKCVGKQKIYFPQHTNASSDKAELRLAYESCQKRIEQVQLNIKTNQNECKELENKLNSLANVRSVKSLEAERVALLDEIRELNERLRHAATQASNGAVKQLTRNDEQRITMRYEHVSQAYRKRKRICLEMLDAISEGYPGTRRELIDDIAIETDEMAEFQIDIQR